MEQEPNFGKHELPNTTHLVSLTTLPMISSSTFPLAQPVQTLLRNDIIGVRQANDFVVNSTPGKVNSRAHPLRTV